jgi:hypothetical protein
LADRFVVNVERDLDIGLAGHVVDLV